MSFEYDLKQTIVSAIKESRFDYIRLAMSLISPQIFIDKLYESGIPLGNEIKDILNSIDHSEISASSIKNLVSYNDYAIFYADTFCLDKGDELKSKILQALASAGKYSLIPPLFDSIKDKSNLINHFNFLAQRLFYAGATLFLGQRKNWTREALTIAHKIGLDFGGKDTERDAWSKNRCETEVRWVGDTLLTMKEKIPVISMEGGIMEASGGHHLLSAYQYEHKKLHSPNFLCDSDRDAFPSHVPALITGLDNNSRADLKRQGFVFLKAESTIDGVPHRGFLDEDNNMANSKICSAMSLLHEEQLLKAHKADPSNLALIPAEKLELIHFNKIPTENNPLSIPMSFHRGYVFDNYYHRKSIHMSEIETSAFMDLYKKGMLLSNLFDKKYLLNNDRIFDELTNEETKFISELGGHGILEYQVKVDDRDPLIVISELRNTLDLIQQKFWFQPKVFINRASAKFIDELAKQHDLINVSSILVIDKNGNGQDYYRFAADNPEYRRVFAKIGLMTKSTQGYTQPSEVIPALMKLKDQDIQQCLLGVLDRFPLEDVLKAAKTKKQFEMLASHYDVTPHMHLIPKSMRPGIAHDKLIQEFEL